MSTGDYLYRVGDAETRDWFERQWRIWPRRADLRLTTNGRLHYEGLLAYRAIHGHEPQMSDLFREHVRVMDRMHGNTALAPLPVEHITVVEPLTKRQRRRMKGKK